jgi:hypothetical protein
MPIEKPKGSGGTPAPDRLQLAAIGMEAEFEVWVDGRKLDPKAVFGTPQRFIRQRLMHRQGTSYHLPTGGAVYFDTGVIEVATPVIEIEPGCAARAGRSLWEAILFVREELDAWERRAGRQVRLVGFSAHYNISFELPRHEQGDGRTVEKLAMLLTHLLPVPVMLLAANRRSTGVGVRPRGDRIEITVDFTPSPALMVATATLITGIVREVMRWPSFELEMLERMRLPWSPASAPSPHLPQGVAGPRAVLSRSPYTSDIDVPDWRTRDGRTLSLRDIGGLITRRFWYPIRRLSDPFTFRLIGSVMRGRAPSLLDLPDRPPEYEDVGRLCTWEDLFPERELSRSRYEQVLIHAIRGERLHLDGRWYTPIGMRGWARVLFRRDDDRARVALPIDLLLRHLGEWGRR